MIERIFDRIEAFDEKSRQFPVIEKFPERQLISKVWHVNTVLDQGREGACVGFGSTHVLLAEPKQGNLDELTAVFAREIYHEAQLIDEFPGQEPEMSGTSVLAGMKTLQKREKIKSFRWAFGLHAALLGLSWYGPAVIGVGWYEGMINPDEHGYIKPTGRLVGGHCCLIHAINIDRKAVRVYNSWGTSWGDNGKAWLSWEDFELLLKRNGECVFIEKV